MALQTANTHVVSKNRRCNKSASVGMTVGAPKHYQWKKTTNCGKKKKKGRKEKEIIAKGLYVQGNLKFDCGCMYIYI